MHILRKSQYCQAGSPRQNVWEGQCHDGILSICNTADYGTAVPGQGSRVRAPEWEVHFHFPQLQGFELVIASFRVSNVE